MSVPAPPNVSIPAAAERLGVSARWVVKLIERGPTNGGLGAIELHRSKRGRELRVPEAELLRYRAAKAKP